MYSTVNHPHDAVREVLVKCIMTSVIISSDPKLMHYLHSFQDIIKLREELVRKEALLNSLQDKTIHWNNELDQLINKQNNMFTIDQERRT